MDKVKNLCEEIATEYGLHGMIKACFYMALVTTGHMSSGSYVEGVVYNPRLNLAYHHAWWLGCVGDNKNKSIVDVQSYVLDADELSTLKYYPLFTLSPTQLLNNKAYRINDGEVEILDDNFGDVLSDHNYLIYKYHPDDIRDMINQFRRQISNLQLELMQ